MMRFFVLGCIFVFYMIWAIFDWLELCIYLVIGVLKGYIDDEGVFFLEWVLGVVCVMY